MSETKSAKDIVSTAENRIADGDRQGWFELLADDVRWTVMGATTWSRTYTGKAVVRSDLTGPLVSQFATPYRREPLQLLAEGDWVAARCQGRVETDRGERYDNQYCFWFHVREGLIDEIIEYGDTALIERVLTPWPGSETVG